jgi:GrpB-like predicted nucleotidyltransferase (UPF0157 family)
MMMSYWERRKELNNMKSKAERTIQVVPHNPAWKTMYEKEARKIKNIFEAPVKIYHIGSTAINGIKAKPVIDILVGVLDINGVDKNNQEMKKLGYVAKGENGIAGRRYFQKGEPQHTYHVHVFETGNKEISRHLNFRDYLNSHPEEAEKYSLLKEKLAKKYRYDASGYTKNKSEHIKQIDKKAKIWSSNE